MSTKTKAPAKAKKPVNPQKKALITAMKKTVNANTVLPILEDILFTPGFAMVSDIENYVSVPFDMPGVPEGGVCIPAKMFGEIMEMVESPSVTVDKHFGVELAEGARKIKLMGEDPMNYLKIPAEDFNHVGTFEKQQIQDIETALCFVSKDDLRPAMTGIYFHTHIAATDAHRLFWKPIDPVMVDFILPAKAAKIMLAMGGEKWEVYHTGQVHVCLINEAGVTIISRCIDARFPDYDAVIPKDKPNLKVFAHPDMLLRELKNAGKFANRSTNQVTFNFNGKATIASQDVDFSFEYQNVVEGVEIHFDKSYGKVMQIAFNEKFLTEVVHKTPADSPVKIDMWGPTKCAVINDHYLVMPLMLGS